jgi:hypothetical protein
MEGEGRGGGGLFDSIKVLCRIPRVSLISSLQPNQARARHSFTPVQHRPDTGYSRYSRYRAYRIQDTGYKIQGHRIQDTGYTGYGIQDTGYGIRDTGYWIQGTRYRIHDTGYRIQDTGYRIRDTGFKIQDTV